jgi:hypothetical protein
MIQFQPTSPRPAGETTEARADSQLPRPVSPQAGAHTRLPNAKQWEQLLEKKDGRPLSADESRWWGYIVQSLMSKPIRETIVGEKIVLGIPKIIKPLEPPQGTISIWFRFREGRAGVAIVRSELGVTRHIILDKQDCWQLGPPTGLNITGKQTQKP